MSEIDELRRIAYGRTSGPVEEAAAADARAALERHEAGEQRLRAEREAAEFALARADNPGHGSGVTQGAHPADHADGDADDDRVALTLVDPDDDDEPGFLRRFAARWRVWTVPAFAAFVIGIVLTVASGLVILQASRTGLSEIVTSGAQVEAPGVVPGDLAHASSILAREQKPEDVTPISDPGMDSTTTHLLRAGTPTSVFAAMSVSGDICVIVVWSDLVSSGTACSPPSEFALRGLLLGSSIDNQTAQVQWDGRTLTETASTR